MTETVEPQATPNPSPHRRVLTGTRGRTLNALFRHPAAHNLEWMDVVSLMGRIGDVEERANGEFAFDVSGARHTMRKPHGKDLTSTEVTDIRRFLADAGWSSDGELEPAAHESTAARSLLVVVDHHEARIYRVEMASDGKPDGDAIHPYDPHHFLHHLTHRDQASERGQRAPEDISFYQRIAEALKAADHVIVVGHGTGKSNAANHLVDYLRAHDPAIHQDIVQESVADLSSITVPQLLDIARTALRQV